MDIKKLSVAWESVFVLLERVWYLFVIPTEPAGLMTKGQGFVLTPVLLQERCCALVALMQELGGFLVLLDIKAFFRNFQLCQNIHHCLNACF